MVAKVQITTTVAADGSVRLLKHEIEAAGVRPGDHVQVKILRGSEPSLVTHAAIQALPDDAPFPPNMPFDEWLARFRADFPTEGVPLDTEELAGLGEEDSAREFWERLHCYG